MYFCIRYDKMHGMNRKGIAWNLTWIACNESKQTCILMR